VTVDSPGPAAQLSLRTTAESGMKRFGWTRLWAAATGLAASLAGTAALAGWPDANPAQPLVQAPIRCALGIAPLNRRCKVVDFAPIGTIDGRDWYYAFYDTHWADRHGKQDRGFPIVFYLQRPATLRLGFWVNDEPGLAGRWARTPPVRPVLIRRPEAAYLGFTLKADQGPDDQRLYRLDDMRWRQISVLYRTDAEEQRIAAATPRDCQVEGDGVYDWRSFVLVMPLRGGRAGQTCGTLIGELEVRRDRLVVVRAALVPPPPAPGAPPKA